MLPNQRAIQHKSSTESNFEAKKKKLSKNNQDPNLVNHTRHRNQTQNNTKTRQKKHRFARVPDLPNRATQPESQGRVLRTKSKNRNPKIKFWSISARREHCTNLRKLKTDSRKTCIFAKIYANRQWSKTLKAFKLFLGL